jgi:hypothetical protein
MCGRIWRNLCALALLFLVLGGAAQAQLSGQFGLDIAARRIPTTESDEIKLDTPSEFAVLEFSIASNLDLKIGCGFATFDIDAAVNMAGPEHAVAAADIRIEPIPFYGATLEKVHLIPEVWFAVPFEAVTDVNNLPNSVLIPPGDPLFVTARLTTSAEVSGFRLRSLVMLEDINFPKPGSSYEPLYYEHVDQDFDVGNLFYATWTAQLGFSANATLGLNASTSGTAIKGYSASGSVDPGNCFLTGSVGGIPFGCVPTGIVTLFDSRVGMSFYVSTTQTLSGTLSFSARLADGTSVGASLTLFTHPRTFGGVSLAGSVGCFRFGVQLEGFELTSLSAGYDTSLNLAGTTGSFGFGLTGLERGLTGLSARLSLAYGVLSASTNVAYAQRGEEFGFASFGVNMSFRFSPGILSFQATFGRFGLTRAAFSVGVSF